MGDRWLAFNDPFFTDEQPYCNTVRLITEEDAIRFMRRIHIETPYSDEEAIHDFMVVNWAWRVSSGPPLAEPQEAI